MLSIAFLLDYEHIDTHTHTNTALWEYSVCSACYGPFPVLGLAWGNYETNPWEPVLLRSFLHTVWRAPSCYLLTCSWRLSIWLCQDQELYPCSVLKVYQWIPALWSGYHSSPLLSGCCPALSRLLSFHPDCSECSAGWSGVVLSLFPCLSSVLLHWHLWGRGFWCSQCSPPSVGRIVRSKPVLCLCWACHRSFSTFASSATFLNTSVFSSMWA